MRCPVCGHETPDNGKKCLCCGSKFRTVRSSTHKMDRWLTPPVPQKRSARLPVVIGSIAAVLALVIAAGAVIPRLLPQMDAPQPSGEPGISPGPSFQIGKYIPYTHHFSAGNMNGSLAILNNQDCMILHDQAYAKIFRQEWSMDGNVFVLLDVHNQMVVATSHYIYQCPEKVYDFRLSADGSAVCYQVLDDSGRSTLYRYHTRDKSTETINSNLSLTQFCISPDGSAIAFVLSTYIDSHIVLYDEGMYSFITQVPFQYLMTVSNDGNLLCGAYKSDIGYSLVVHYRESSFSLGSFDRDSMIMNYDHSQILYTYGGRSFLFAPTDKSDRLPISLGQGTSLLLSKDAAARSSNSVVTYPVEDFSSQIYTRLDVSGVYQAGFFLQESFVSTVQGMEQWILSDSRLYYTKNGSLWCYCFPTGVSTELVKNEAVSSFCVNSDLCYAVTDRGIAQIRQDGSLQYIPIPPKLGKTPQIYTDNLGSLYLSNSDCLYQYDPKTANFTLLCSSFSQILPNANGVLYYYDTDHMLYVIYNGILLRIADNWGNILQLTTPTA